MDQADAGLRDMLQQGIKAAQAKRKTEAYAILSQVVRQDPQSEPGWLWLAAVAPSPQESLAAFGRVLAINPANEQARVGQRWAAARLQRGTGPDSAPGSSVVVVPAAPPTPPAVPAPPTGAAEPRPALSSESLAGIFAPAATAPSARPPEPSHPAAATPTPAPPASPAARPITAPLEDAAAPASGPPVHDSAAPADDWRAGGDLSVAPAGVNWDDDGAELRPADGASGAPRGIACPNCGAPGQTGAVCSLCNTPLAPPIDAAELDPALRGVVFAPAMASTPVLGATGSGLDLSAPASPAGSAPFTPATLPAAEPLPPAAPSAYTESLQPVARRGSLLPLLLGALLLIAGLFIAANGLFGAQNTANGSNGVAQSFFEAQLRKDYAAAAGYLAPQLQSTYLPAKDIPELNLTAKLGALPSPQIQATSSAVAQDSNTAESIVRITPPTGAAVLYLVHLTHAGGSWLIDQIHPYSAQ